MSKKGILLIFLILLVTSVYAQELEPGNLWINGVEIPYSIGEEGDFRSSEVLTDISERTGKYDQHYCSYDETRDKIAIIIKENGIYDNQDVIIKLNQYFTAVKDHLDIDNVGVKKFDGSTIEEFDNFIENFVKNEYVGYIISIGVDLPIVRIDENKLILDHETINNVYSFVGKAREVEVNECIDVAISTVIAPQIYFDENKREFIKSIFSNFIDYHNNPIETYNQFNKEILSIEHDNSLVGDKVGDRYNPDNFLDYETVYFYPVTYLLNSNNNIDSYMKEKNLILMYNVHGAFDSLGLGLNNNIPGLGLHDRTYATNKDVLNFYEDNGKISLFINIGGACGQQWLSSLDDIFCCWPQTWLKTGVWAVLNVGGEPYHHNFERWLSKEKIVGKALRKTYHNQDMIYGDILAVLPEIGEPECIKGIKGDVNNDNNVDAYDLLETFKILENGLPSGDVCCCCTDINNDNIVNIPDMIELLDLIESEEIEVCGNGDNQITGNVVSQPLQIEPYVDEQGITCGNKGDLNNDTSIDIFDLLKLLKAFSDKVEYNENNKCADLNEDEIINIFDLLELLKLLKERVDDISISIATIKDVYEVGEKIELTDPPNKISFNSNEITGNVINKNINLRQDIIYETPQINVEEIKKEFNEGIIPEIIDTSSLPKYVKGELIVKLKKDISNKITGSAIKTDITSIDELNRKHNVEKIENVFKVKKEGFLELAGNTAKELIGIKVPKRELKKIYRLEIPEDANVEEIIEDYKKDPQVEYAEPNYISYISFAPNDARYSEQWAYQNTEAEQGWDIERGNENVVIAIVDTGVDYNHEDLAANIWNNIDEIPDNGIDDDENGYVDDIMGYDFVDIDVEACNNNPDCELVEGEDYTEIDNDPMDFKGHGTHVAGIAAAVTDNNLGIAGVCHNCKIMPVRAGYSIKVVHIMYGFIETGRLRNDGIASAIHYAADNGANIISMSFGSSGISNVQKEAIDYAYSKGVVLIASAGNSNTDSKSYPAGYDDVIAVAATAETNERSSYSNYGYWVDIAAPGGDFGKDTAILSTVLPYTTYNSELLINGNVILSNVVFEYSATTSDQGINGELVYVNLGKTEDITMNLTGKIALIWRGEITFKEKVENVYNAGAIGAIIYNNGNLGFRGTLKEQANIPVVSISMRDGANLISQLDYEKVTVNLKVFLATNNYAFYQGTSMAAPYVAGLAGLILSKQDYNQEEVRQILRQSVDSVNSDKYIGTGRINVKKVLEFEPVDAVAEISSPENEELISNNIIDIIGSATGDRYIVHYSEGLYPINWIEIGSGTNVNNGVLASWNIENIDEGDYTIKLSVSKDDRIIDDFVRVTIGRGYQDGWPKDVGFWSRPINSEDLDNDGKPELVIGTGDGYLHIFRYNGEYFSDSWPKKFDSLTTLAIEDLDNNGIKDIIIAEPGTFDYFPNGRLHVLNPDGSYLEGWPVVLEGHIGEVNSPVVGDIDNDGDPEIVIGVGGSTDYGGSGIVYYNKIYAFHHDGSLVNGWPVESDGQLQPRSTPLLVDLDHDNDLEIIIGSKKIDNTGGAIEAFHHDGTKVSGFPFYNNDWNWIIAAGDVNKDGEIEIITHGTMIDAQGRIIEEWNAQEFVISNLALADVNNDDYLEIIYGGGGTGEVNLVDHNGNSLPGWPVTISPGLIVDGNPVVGDIDGDREVEILIGAYQHNGLYAWNLDGSIVEGFPKISESPNRDILINDLDGDGDVEVVSASSAGRIYVWDLEASYNPSTMHWPMFQHDPQHTGAYTKPESEYHDGWPKSFFYDFIHNIGDLDDDGYKEVIISARHYTSFTEASDKLEVYSHDGSLIWEKELMGVGSTPLIGDLNNNRDKEIVIVTFNNQEKNSILRAFSYTEEILWEKSIPTKFSGSRLLIADMDNDMDNDVVYKSHLEDNNKLIIFDGPTGDIISEWDLEFSHESHAAVGNFDDDQELEIVLYGEEEYEGEYGISERCHIYMYNIDGTYVDGWPVQSKGDCDYSPVIGDVDNDNSLDIFTSRMWIEKNGLECHYGTCILDRHGNIHPSSESIRSSNPSLADFDNDGYLEIVGSFLLETYIYNHDGTLVPGWPQLTSNDWDLEPIIGDLDGDGVAEILVNELRALNYNPNEKGLFLEGFNIILSDETKGTPVISDIDKDGKIELIVKTKNYFDDGYSKLHILDLDSKYDPSTMHWPMFRHDPQHTGNYDFGKEKSITEPERPQSKIWNQGERDVKGILTFYIENLDNGMKDQIYQSNELTINPGDKLGLDTIFNPIGISLESGNYKVIAVFETEQNRYEASYDFVVEGERVESLCETCGDGLFNICDEEECMKLGDCLYGIGHCFDVPINYEEALRWGIEEDLFNGGTNTLSTIKDVNACLIVKINEQRTHSYHIDSLNEEIYVASADNLQCNGIGNEDIIIAYSRFSGLQDFAKKDSCNVLKTTNINKYHLWESKFIKQYEGEFKVDCTSEFERKYCDFIKQCTTQIERNQINCCLE